MNVLELRKRREQQEDVRQENEFHRSYNKVNGLPNQLDVKRREGPRPLPAEGTLPMMILKVAKTLSQPFTLTQLVLACWKSDPAKFGLQGAETESADSHRVYVPLCGERGLVKMNLLRKVGNYLYEVVGEDK